MLVWYKNDVNDIDWKPLNPQMCPNCDMDANPQPCGMLQIHLLADPSKQFVQVVPGQKYQAPVEFYLSDAISNTLFSLWHAHHAPSEHAGTANNVYVFPLVTPSNQFDFIQHMKESEHRRACQLVVDTLGLQVSTEFRNGLGCNSLRRGNAAKLGAELRGADIFDSMIGDMCLSISIWHIYIYKCEQQTQQMCSSIYIYIYIYIQMCCEVRASSFELRTSSFELRASNFELRALTFELRASSFELRAPSFELRAASFKLRASSFELRSSSFEL
jgi:hypothetical protein